MLSRNRPTEAAGLKVGMKSERPYSSRRSGTGLRRAIRRVWVSGRRSLDPSFLRALRKPAPFVRTARTDSEARLRAAILRVQRVPVRVRALVGTGAAFALCVASFGAQSFASRPFAPTALMTLEARDALGMGGPMVAEDRTDLEPASAGVTLLAASSGRVGSRNARPCTPKRELIEALGSVEEGQEIEEGGSGGEDFAEGPPAEPGGPLSSSPEGYAFNNFSPGGEGGPGGDGPGGPGGPGGPPPATPPGGPGQTTPAVPEPTTWAMMILGFGAIGAALRRRRSIGAARA